MHQAANLFDALDWPTGPESRVDDNHINSLLGYTVYKHTNSLHNGLIQFSMCRMQHTNSLLGYTNMHGNSFTGAIATVRDIQTYKNDLAYRSDSDNLKFHVLVFEF